MKRYNQGFFKFGPMEMCNTGTWNKWEDTAQALVNLHKIHVKELAKKDEEIDQLKAELNRTIMFFQSRGI